MLKTITIDGLDRPVTLARRKGTRSLKIAIKNNGEVRLTVPYGIPEIYAKQFLIKKIDWINQHRPSQQEPLLNGARIGKGHRLQIEKTDANRQSTRIKDIYIQVKLPKSLEPTDPEAQTHIIKACEKALLAEATQLLPQRLEMMSKRTGIPYKSCSVKKLKSRWGACDTHNNISLNIFLIQLDWTLIDYVIFHELAHTKEHNHQEPFWALVETICPDYKKLRRELRSKPTAILPTFY